MSRTNLPGIGFTEDQIEIGNMAADFCRDRSPIDAVRARMAAGNGLDKGLWDEMVGLGWPALTINEAHGGVGLGLNVAAMIAEQAGRRLMQSPLIASILVAEAIQASGNAAMQAAVLPELAGGAIASLARHEAHGDWTWSNVTCTAKGGSGDQAILSGTKHLVEWASDARWLLATVRADDGVRLALVETASLPAGACVAERNIDPLRMTHRVSLDGVPAIILSASESAAGLKRAEQVQALLGAAEMVGATKGVIDYTLSYLSTRKQFGRLIGEYQALKHPMVDGYVAYEDARSLMLSAAHVIEDADAAALALPMAVASAQAVLAHMADRAIQFHGGFGFTRDCDAGLYRRHAIWQAANLGDAAWHRARLADLVF